MEWKLAEAKNKFSEVMDLTERDGPQLITRRGKTFVLITLDEYQQQQGNKPNFIEYLLNGPSFEGVQVELDPEFDKVREIKL
jgi:prevent-host-death family protein